MASLGALPWRVAAGLAGQRPIACVPAVETPVPKPEAKRIHADPPYQAPVRPSAAAEWGAGDARTA
jgi:hypothetical protein